MRQDKKRTAVNRRLKNKTKKTLKAFQSSPSAEGLKKTYSALDTAAKKKIFSKNKTSRLKSRLAKLLVLK